MKTKAALDRFDKLQRIGCIIAHIRGEPHVLGDIHHITDCGRRLGDMHTIMLSAWAHRGVTTWPYSPKEMARIFGPSLALSKRLFTRAFGSELQLLAKTNALIEPKIAPCAHKWGLGPRGMECVFCGQSLDELEHP